MNYLIAPFETALRLTAVGLVFGLPFFFLFWVAAGSEIESPFAVFLACAGYGLVLSSEGGRDFMKQLLVGLAIIPAAMGLLFGGELLVRSVLNFLS